MIPILVGFFDPFIDHTHSATFATSGCVFRVIRSGPPRVRLSTLDATSAILSR